LRSTAAERRSLLKMSREEVDQSKSKIQKLREEIEKDRAEIAARKAIVKECDDKRAKALAEISDLERAVQADLKRKHAILLKSTHDGDDDNDRDEQEDKPPMKKTKTG
jgi:peptidoglycan hydrolase CwlO-like protein